MEPLRFAAATRDARDLPAVLRRTRSIEAMGFDTVGFADTQTLHPDPFVVMAAAAAAGSGLRLMTNLSNPVTRHPSVTATAIAGVQQLARGGAVFALGAGDTSLLNIGRRPAHLAEVRAYVETLRSLQDHGAARFGEDVIRYGTPPGRVPIHLGAHGPRSLALAGEVADGVWIGTGADPETVTAALGRVREGLARRASPADGFEIGCYVRCWIGDPVEGEREMAPSLAAVGHYTLCRAPGGKGIPAALAPAFAALERRYDSISHGIGGAENPNARLIRELGLAPYLAGRFAVMGSPAEVAGRLAVLVGLGVSSFFIMFRGNVDEQMGLFARDVIPAMRARNAVKELI